MEATAGVDRLTVDQTASERVLHRVLYVIKFLRTMVMHIVLAGLAVGLFLSTGITGFYPVADYTIHALRGEAIHQRQQAGLFDDPVSFAIVLAVVSVVVLFMLVWIYRSIVAVKRKALKFQSFLIVFVTLLNMTTFWPNLQFAFDKLNPTFAVLAAVAVGLSQFVFPLLVALSLRRVARAPERSSLLATLDSRLASGPWAYFNKLLDLPRTPLQTPGTLAAYALALAGMIVMTASLMHLLTVGGANNRLGVLARCDADLLPDCVALSSAWARELPLTLLLAAVGLKVSSWLQSTAKRLGGLGVSDVLKRPDDPFVLYLRPFDTDEVVLPTPKLPWWSRLFSFRPLSVRIEEELFDVADGHRPLIAVGKPGGEQATPGGLAYRAYLADSAWQDYVADKIRRAERIVLVMKDSAGVRWEIERVIAEAATGKTLFLFDPAVASIEEWETLERMLAPLLRGERLAPEGAALAARPIGFFFRGRTRVDIVNENRSATSYRTAFSTFLAESAE